jgi:pimeloyl-ACP methyl ester carboxylesterase
MSASSTPLSTPEGPGSVSGAPNLPAGFTARAMKPAADDVQTVVIPVAGHWVAEQAPEELLATLTAFLAPYRDRG